MTNPTSPILPEHSGKPSTDRELLELAARAAGIEKHYPFGKGAIYVRFAGPYAFRDTSDDVGALKKWNPIDDNGDAFSLAVKRRIRLTFLPDGVYASGVGETAISEFEPFDGDPEYAARRAVVRAAAKIGASDPATSPPTNK